MYIHNNRKIYRVYFHFFIFKSLYFLNTHRFLTNNINKYMFFFYHFLNFKYCIHIFCISIVAVCSTQNTAYICYVYKKAVAYFYFFRCDVRVSLWKKNTIIKKARAHKIEKEIMYKIVFTYVSSKAYSCIYVSIKIHKRYSHNV